MLDGKGVDTEYSLFVFLRMKNAGAHNIRDLAKRFFAEEAAGATPP